MDISRIIIFNKIKNLNIIVEYGRSGRSPVSRFGARLFLGDFSLSKNCSDFI